MKAAVREIEKRLMQSTDAADRVSLLIDLANAHASAFEIELPAIFDFFEKHAK